MPYRHQRLSSTSCKRSRSGRRHGGLPSCVGPVDTRIRSVRQLPVLVSTRASYLISGTTYIGLRSYRFSTILRNAFENVLQLSVRSVSKSQALPLRPTCTKFVIPRANQSCRMRIIRAESLHIKSHEKLRRRSGVSPINSVMPGKNARATLLLARERKVRIAAAPVVTDYLKSPSHISCHVPL